MDELEQKKGVTITVIESVRKELVQASLERGVTVAGLVRMLIYDYLKARREEKEQKAA